MLKSVTILHVDDEPGFADMVATFLEQEHDQFNVITTTSPIDAFDQLRAAQIDCIVSDYDMPEQNGIAFLKNVREHHPDLPFILYTGKGSEEVAGQAISAGVTEYLQKDTGTSQYTVLANRIQNVVEQHRAQQATTEAQQQLTQLAEQTDDVLFSIAHDFTELEFVNSAYAEIWGESPTVLRDDPTQILDAVVPEHQSKVKQAIQQVADGTAQTVTCQITRADDQRRWLHISAKPVLDEHGNVTRIVGIARDITEQKQREQTLQELRQRFEFAVNGANLGVWDWNMQTDEVIFNDNWATMLGYEPAEIDSDLVEWKQRVHPNDFQAVQAALDEHIAGQTEYYATEHRMRTADGNWKWIHDVGKIFERDEDGTPTRAVGIHIDIDDRKQAELRLKQERDMFAQGPVVTFKWQNKADWPVEYVSDNVTEVLGYTPAEVTASDFQYADLIHDNDFPRVLTEVENNSDPETAFFKHQPYRMQTNTGEHVWVLDHTKNIRDDDGTITHRLGYIIDITAQKQREQVLKRQNERLDKFASTLSHDIKSPLNVAKGRLRLATETCESPHLEDVSDALTRIEELVDDLLALARQGDQISDRKPVQIDNLIRECWQSVSTTRETLTIHTDMTVHADRTRLKQAIENLLSNAVEHSDEPVQITVTETENGFAIADNGTGIPAAAYEDIFEPGYSTDDMGTGFGLPIVNDIIEAHGWEITVTESDWDGAQFNITGVDSSN